MKSSKDIPKKHSEAVGTRSKVTASLYGIQGVPHLVSCPESSIIQLSSVIKSIVIKRYIIKRYQALSNKESYFFLVKSVSRTTEDIFHWSAGSQGGFQCQVNTYEKVSKFLKGLA